MKLAQLLGYSLGAGLTILSFGVSEKAMAEGSFTFGNSTYYLTNALDWNNAQAAAVQMGGNLVTINSAEEQDFLNSSFGSAQLYWTGLNDIEVEGTFEWASGEEVTYANFAVDEPNNWQGLEDVVTMNWDGAGAWNDYPDNFNLLGIVEVVGDAPPQATPEASSTMGLLAIGLLGAVSYAKKKQAK
jgi:hypothetical protein